MAEAPTVRERLKEPPSPKLVESYYRPAVARAQRAVFGHEMWAHCAHALMLERQGIVARPPLTACLREVLALAEAGPAAVPVDFSQEDLYSYVEKQIIGALGAEVGGRLHTGRSRNDLNATTWRMALRERLLDLLDALAALRGTALRLAQEHAGTVMPGYTHSQHAQPITFGYWLLAAADALGRDHTRLAGALVHADQCPLGAGALTTSGFPLDRDFAARQLGFPALLEVAYDAVASRDDALEAASAMAILASLLSRLATDLMAWNTAEYAFVELADRHCAVSSIMPQKKNPAALEHIRAAAAMIGGAQAAALACTKNTPFGDVNDAVTAVNEPVLEAAERTTRVVLLFAEVLEALTLHPVRMARAAAEGFGSATELADAIVRERGLSFRVAHSVVVGVVRAALAAGQPADAITAADVDAAAQAVLGAPLGLSSEVVAEALDPAANIRARNLPGGPAPAEMARMIAAREAGLAAARSGLAAARGRIEAARTGCLAAAAILAGSRNG